MDAQGRIAALHEMVEAFNRRDFDAALRAAAEDLTWQPFLARTETPLLRGRAAVKAAWESQVEALDLRIESTEFIPMGDSHVVVPARLVARGRGSDLALDASVAFLVTFGEDGLARHVVTHESQDEALRAASRPD